MRVVRFNQALEIWRCHNFQGFEGQHQCFIFCAGSDQKPVEGMEKGGDTEKAFSIQTKMTTDLHTSTLAVRLTKRSGVEGENKRGDLD